MSCKAPEGPNLTGEGICDGGAPVLCGGSQCCNSAAEARNVCGVRFGPTYGWSNTWAQAIPKESKNYVDCGRSGAAYECRATIAPSCPNRYNRPYNKDGPYGSHRVGVQPTNSSEWNRRDAFCREKNGPNAVMTTTPRPDIAPGAVKEECDIFEWKTQPLEQCCTPGSQTTSGLYESLCGPQTCFGKPACDNALVTQTICSDRDNVTKDQACVDTCITNNTDTKKQQACVDACKLAAATRDQLCMNTCVRLNESGGR